MLGPEDFGEEKLETRADSSREHLGSELPVAACVNVQDCQVEVDCQEFDAQ